MVMAKNLFIANDAPYGIERTYNALRLAGSLSSREGEEVRLFLIGDAVSAAKRGQQVPQGFYNVEVMLRRIVRSGGEIGVCGSCSDARAIADDLAEGCRRSSMEELTDWTVWADNVVVF